MSKKEEEKKLEYPKKLYGQLHQNHSYEPFYDENSDFNTNAKSYFDYLARFNRQLRAMVDFINEMADKQVNLGQTDSVTLMDDETFLKAFVNISNEVGKFKVEGYTTVYNVNNGIKIVENDPNDPNKKGLWTPDYQPVFDGIAETMIQQFLTIMELQYRIETLEENQADITEMKNGFQKIINNLYDSGSITTKEIGSFNFRSDRNIATGNINFFGGVSDGTKFIKTSNMQTENDISAGY